MYKTLSDLRRSIAITAAMTDRAKEQVAEMAPLATSIPVLNSQLKETILHLDSIDGVKPEIGMFYLSYTLHRIFHSEYCFMIHHFIIILIIDTNIVSIVLNYLYVDLFGIN